MIKKKSRFFRLAISCLLCGGLLLNQPTFIYAAGTDAAAPTPTPNPHTEYYTQ